MTDKPDSPEKGFVSNLRAGTIPRVSGRRNIGRVLFVTSVILLLFFAWVHQPRRAQEIEESVLRYLSLTSEEQARLHDSRLASLQAGLEQCALLKDTPV